MHDRPITTTTKYKNQNHVLFVYNLYKKLNVIEKKSMT